MILHRATEDFPEVDGKIIECPSCIRHFNPHYTLSVWKIQKKPDGEGHQLIQILVCFKCVLDRSDPVGRIQ